MRFLTRVVTLAAAGASPLMLAAAASAQGSDSGGSGIDVVPPAIWTAVGVGVGAVVFGTLYLLKKQVGGFPEHPAWVAPIEIIQSKTLPSEPPEDHGGSHDDHGGSHH